MKDFLNTIIRDLNKEYRILIKHFLSTVIRDLKQEYKNPLTVYDSFK